MPLKELDGAVKPFIFRVAMLIDALLLLFRDCCWPWVGACPGMGGYGCVRLGGTVLRMRGALSWPAGWTAFGTLILLLWWFVRRETRKRGLLFVPCDGVYVHVGTLVGMGLHVWFYWSTGSDDLTVIQQYLVVMYIGATNGALGW